MIYWAVGIAGMLGALLRYYIGEAVDLNWAYSFPLGTLLINYVGCLVLGMFTTGGSMLKIPAWLRVGFSVGLVGSFTTFSTFSMETVTLLQQGLILSSLLYVLLSLTGGLLLALVGYKLGLLMKSRLKGAGDL